MKVMASMPEDRELILDADAAIHQRGEQAVDAARPPRCPQASDGKGEKPGCVLGDVVMMLCSCDCWRVG